MRFKIPVWLTHLLAGLGLVIVFAVFVLVSFAVFEIVIDVLDRKTDWAWAERMNDRMRHFDHWIEKMIFDGGLKDQLRVAFYARVLGGELCSCDACQEAYAPLVKKMLRKKCHDICPLIKIN